MNGPTKLPPIAVPNAGSAYNEVSSADTAALYRSASERLVKLVTRTRVTSTMSIGCRTRIQKMYPVAEMYMSCLALVAYGYASMVMSVA
ncbi:hypothetical protein D1872_293620 [compost metagenome]